MKLPGIWVVNSVYNWGGADADSAAAPVKATKDHPAILMWTIGNLLETWWVLVALEHWLGGWMMVDGWW